MSAPSESDPKIFDVNGPLIPTPWSKLNARTRRRVQLLLDQLIEMEAGSRHSVKVVESTSDPNHPLARFMLKAALVYLHGCFMAGATGAQDVLRSLNLAPLAKQIDDVLELPIGDKTLKRFLSEQRHTTLAHPSFDPDAVLRRVFDSSDLKDKKIENQFRNALGDMMILTRFMHRYLREEYPLAAAASDARWKPVHKPPPRRSR